MCLSILHGMTSFVSYRSLSLFVGLAILPFSVLESEDLSLRKGSGHWAFKPVKRSVPPRVKDTPNPIDSFIRSKLSQNGLDPSPEASKAVLFRRLSLDLTGLPPSF